MKINKNYLPHVILILGIGALIWMFFGDFWYSTKEHGYGQLEQVKLIDFAENRSISLPMGFEYKEEVKGEGEAVFVHHGEQLPASIVCTVKPITQSFDGQESEESYLAFLDDYWKKFKSERKAYFVETSHTLNVETTLVPDGGYDNMVVARLVTCRIPEGPIPFIGYLVFVVDKHLVQIAFCGEDSSGEPSNYYREGRDLLVGLIVH